MNATVVTSPAATPRERLAGICGQPIKAELRREAAEAIRRVTSQKAAATDIGIDQGRLSHKLTDGSLTLAQLETLGPAYAAELGRQLLEQYGPLATPKARAKQRIRDARQALDELDQVLEHIA